MFKSKTFKQAFINEDKTKLKLIGTDDKVHLYTAYGDCCSCSWFEHIEGLTNLIGKCPVFEEEHVNVEDFWNSDESEQIQVYAHKLRTMDGYITIEYRNSSNGYYGGWVEYSEGDDPKTNWKELTEDF